MHVTRRLVESHDSAQCCLLPEQKRIVTILDQAFAEIEQARALAEKNLNNARELFESYLQQVFSQRGEGWIERSLSFSIMKFIGYWDLASAIKDRKTGLAKANPIFLQKTEKMDCYN